MLWRILKETPTTDDEGNVTGSTWEPTGEVYNDGFAADGSEWSDEESAAVTAKLDALQAETGVCHSAAFVPPA